jgi:precorrin-2 dehydrogenase/sirohydrochlorin ferrochelatase
MGFCCFRRVNEGRVFPVFLKLEGRRALVIGAGQVAEGKIRGLLEAGARVEVVAPMAAPQVKKWASEGRILWKRRKFTPADLDEAFLAVAATGSRELNAEISSAARARRVLLNAVDDPRHCDFYYPAVVRRGELAIAISTGGQSPALAQRLRHELEAQFGPDYAEWVAELGRVRQRLADEVPDGESRRKLLHQMASRAAFERRNQAHGRSD